MKWSVYGYYAKSVGYAASVAATFFYVSFQGFSVGANLWLSRFKIIFKDEIIKTKLNSLVLKIVSNIFTIEIKCCKLGEKLHP